MTQPLTRAGLTECFSESYEGLLGKMYYPFYAVALEIEGYDGLEIILNEGLNAEQKLAYYLATYDENLQHKFAKGIRIVAYDFDATPEAVIDRLYMAVREQREDATPSKG